MKRAIYSGTFDPITLGHTDIIKRACKIFDEVIVAVALSTSKKPMFSLEQRVEMAKLSTKKLSNVKVIGFDTLLVDFAKEHESDIIIRGLRAVSDFEYELQMGYANSSINPNLETIYLMPNLQHSFISSSIVRTLLNFGGKIEHLITPEVHRYIKEIS
jgi:pantetheine-phosphate adenylyltransferase